MSNNKQQTAVEYLVEQLFPKALSAEQYYHIEQAKAMHKKEMVDFANDLIAQNDPNYIGFPNLAEQYYNETYGGNNEQQ